jgi:polyphosphate kinase
MKRNLLGRVETCFPIRDPKLFKRVYKQGLEIYLKDNTGAFILEADGSYTALTPSAGEEPYSAQQWLVKKYSN